MKLKSLLLGALLAPFALVALIAPPSNAQQADDPAPEQAQVAVLAPPTPAPAPAAQAPRRPLDRAWRQRLALARSFSDRVDLDGDLIKCELEDAYARPRRRTGEARTDLLLTVSEQPLVLFIAHGFEFREPDGRHSFRRMRDEFADHIRIARDQPGGSAVCFVSWYSQDGFGDDQPHLADALAIVRRLAADPLLPPSGAEGAPRRVVALGYSAGGNFIKHAAILALDTEAAMPAPRRPLRAAPLRIVGLGTPHFGAPIARNGVAAGQLSMSLMSAFGALIGDDDLVASARGANQEFSRVQLSRGMEQLSADNRDLAALNAAFAARASELEYINIVSVDDDIVPFQNADWDVGVQQALHGLLHRDLQHAAPESDYARFLALAYGPAPLTEAISQ